MQSRHDESPLMNRERLLRLLLTALLLFTVFALLPRRPVNHVDFTTYVVVSLAWLEGKGPYHACVQ